MIIIKIPNLTHFPVPIGYCIDWINGPEMKQTVALQCPVCNHAFCLADHNIENGNVSPSVVCPHGCGFHVFMTIQ